MASTDARPIPRKNAAYRVAFPMLNADGALVPGMTAGEFDSEISKDGGTFADCTNEAVEIATNSGIYYLDLTADEMNADMVLIKITSASGSTLPTTLYMYPEEAGDIRVDVTAISGDTTAADNLESYTDGTTPMPVNATQISGDATAADNLEAALDGTGGVTLSAALSGNITGNLSGSVGSVTGAVGSVTGNVGGNLSGSVGSVTGNIGGNVSGSVGSLATQAKADVNAEVVDAINTDTYAEPGQGAPAATASLASKIGYLYKAWRNKIEQTTTTYKLHADDASTVDQQATVSDDGSTFTRGEIGSG